MTRLFEIWMEGFHTNSERGYAQFVGFSEGETFEQALDAHYQRHPSEYYDPIRRTYWACRHFDNEADARKVFG